MGKYSLTVLEKVLRECNEAFTANTPILYILTDEMEFIDQIVEAQTMVELVDYSNTEDLFIKAPQTKGKLPSNYKINEFPKYDFLKAPEIYVFKHFNLMNISQDKLSNYINQYLHCQLGSFLKRSILLLAAPILTLPEGLEPYIQVIEVPYPEDFEIKTIIKQFNQQKYKEPLSESYISKLSISLKGFRQSKIISVLKKIISQTGYLCNESKKRYEKEDTLPETVAFEIIRNEKEQLLKKSGKLRLEKEELVSIGGLRSLRNWIEENKIILDTIEEAKEWGIEVPKGVLVCGIPGSGKSLMAKMTSQLLDIPLISMDMGSMMGKYLGESENNIRTALTLSEAMSPCVIWIDELEKSFAGTNSDSANDSGTLKRAFATFLTWLQNKKAPCFIFATANTISSLPSEFLRKGRFDQKFYVYMPMREECKEIFQALLKQTFLHSKQLFNPDIIEDTPFLYDLIDYCVRNGRKKFLTGADINGIINDGMKSIYIELKKNKFSVQEPYKITKKQLESALKYAIDTNKTYGETNLTDIADYFIELQKTEFLPASGNDDKRVLFQFHDFCRSSSAPISKTSDNLDNIYDKILFDTLKMTINTLYQNRIKMQTNH